MANPLICVFNPITTLIDVIPAASLGPSTPGIPVVTNLNGLVDTSLLGLGSQATAGETIAAGQLVNLYSSAGTLHAQLAFAGAGGSSPSGATYPIQAQGFANSNAVSGGSLTINFTGTFIYIDGHGEFSSANIGQEVYLSGVDKGGITLTPPVALEEAVGYVVAFTAPSTVQVNFIAGFQDFSHISGVNPISKGGTGATTAPQALINLIGGTPATGQALIWNGTAWVPGTDTTTFGQITTGTNTTATMTVAGTALLTFSGSGNVNASQIQGNPILATVPVAGQALVWNGAAWAPSNAAVTGFNDITSGTNTTAAMVVGSGASLSVTGTGTIQATQIWGVVVSSAPPVAGQGLVATSPTAANWQTVVVEAAASNNPGLTASFPLTTIFTPTTTGMYRVSVYAEGTVAGASAGSPFGSGVFGAGVFQPGDDNVQVVVGWTDDVTARTTTPDLFTLDLGNTNAASDDVFIRAVAGQPITLQTFLNNTGTPTYGVFARVEAV